MLFILLFEFVLRKKLKIIKPKGYYHRVNNLHKRVELGLIIVFFFSSIVTAAFSFGHFLSRMRSIGGLAA
ncbi:DUF4181 domain-containing protein [Neobacillus rhizosphaerae]|uniref:DUF4181 domain-containing protein n=1 Tax=Neobacillus rhizosphaerae TaxID=2880965 RepID=UPI00387370AE